MTTFDQAFDKLLGHEGGYSYHPSDPGGETMWGVTARVARQNGYRGEMRDLPRETAKAIYRKLYWDASRCEELPDRLKFVVFDGAVNSGVSQSVVWLQRSLGVDDDGVIGPQTMRAASQSVDPMLPAKILAHRLRFMSSLAHWPAFSRGWADCRALQRRPSSFTASPMHPTPCACASRTNCVGACACRSTANA